MFYVFTSVQWKSIVQESPIRTLPRYTVKCDCTPLCTPLSVKIDVYKYPRTIGIYLKRSCSFIWEWKKSESRNLSWLQFEALLTVEVIKLMSNYKPEFCKFSRWKRITLQTIEKYNVGGQKVSTYIVMYYECSYEKKVNKEKRR